MTPVNEAQALYDETPDVHLVQCAVTLDLAQCRALAETSEGRSQLAWAAVRTRAREDLALRLGRFVLLHPGALVENVAERVDLAFQGDPAVVAYIVAAYIFVTNDASDALANAEPAADGTSAVRLRTRCGCESRTTRQLDPIPHELLVDLPRGGFRRFRLRGYNTFGTALYHEV